MRLATFPLVPRPLATLGCSRQARQAPAAAAFTIAAALASGIPGPAGARQVVTEAESFIHQEQGPPGRTALLATAAILAASSAFLALRLRSARAREIGLAEEARQQTRRLEEERRRGVAALERAALTTEDLRALVGAKSRGLIALAQELGTPVEALLAALQDLPAEDVARLPETSAARVRQARHMARKLDALTHRVGELAQAEAATIRMSLVPTDVGPFLSTLAETMAPQAEARSVALALELPGEALVVDLDPDRMERALGNVLDNAIRHSLPGGTVTIRALAERSATPAVVVLEIEDHGPGIPAERLPRVFDPDVRAFRSRGGRGLGLSISRDIVLLHGGRISLASEPRTGTTVTITLPLAPAAPPPSEAVLDAAILHAGAADGPLGGPSPSILLVEDDPFHRISLRLVLDERYAVAEAADGLQALEHVRRTPPDLVISDVMMPGLDGVSLCRMLKADPATAFVPVVLLTAKTAPEARLEGLSAGADDYLPKPVDVPELHLKIRNLLSMKRRLEERQKAQGPRWPSVMLRPAVEQVDESDQRFLGDVYTAIMDRLGDPDLDVEKLAAAVYTSRSNLYRRMGAVLDRPPMDVIWEVRLEQAALFLRESALPVTEVAFRVGFKSVAHFSRRFRSHFGVPPTGYRAAYASAGPTTAAGDAE